MNTFFLMFGAIVTGNVVLTQFQGCCPFLGVSKKQSTALGMGCAVTFVLTVSGAATYAVYHLLLEPLRIPYMMTMAFILVIASLVQMTEMVIRKISPRFIARWGCICPLSPPTAPCSVRLFPR
jgi:electron transport complex protein RnfA